MYKSEEEKKEQEKKEEEVLKKDIKLFKNLNEQEQKIFSQKNNNKNDKKYSEIKLITGKDNLKQAILLKLLTTKGKLEEIGHEDYGIGLISFIGKSSNPHFLGEIKQSLEEDPRIDKVILNKIKEKDIIKIKAEITAAGEVIPMQFEL